MTYPAATEHHNFKPANITRIKQSLEDAQNGTVVEWVVNSDSSASVAVTGVSTYDHLLAWPILMRDELELAGIPIAGTGMVRRLDNTIVDHRWTQSGTWFFNFLTFAYTVTNGATSTFTTDLPGDRVAVRWYDGGPAEASSFSITVAGGTPTVVSTSATPGWRTHIVNESLTAAQTVVLTKVSGAYLSVAAVCVWDSAGGLLIHNVGQGGSTAHGVGTGHNRWIADNVRESLGQVFTDICVTGNDPALVIIPLGGNDKKDSVSDTDTLDAIQTIRERYPNSDALLIGENQLNDIYVTQATWETYLAALYVRATAMDVPVIDQYARLGDYDAVVAAGKNADAAGHLTPAALEDLGRSLGALLLQGETLMAVTAFFYGNAFVSAFDKKIDFNSDTIKVALCTSTYTPNQDTHDYFNDITNEVTGTGYTAGGATLGSPSITYTGGTNTLMLDGADVSWTTQHDHGPVRHHLRLDPRHSGHEPADRLRRLRR